MMFNGVRFSFLLSIVLVLTFTSEVFSRSAACKKLRVRSPEQSELKGNRAKPFSSSAIRCERAIRACLGFARARLEPDECRRISN